MHCRLCINCYGTVSVCVCVEGGGGKLHPLPPLVSYVTIYADTINDLRHTINELRHTINEVRHIINELRLITNELRNTPHHK